MVWNEDKDEEEEEEEEEEMDGEEGSDDDEEEEDVDGESEGEWVSVSDGDEEEEESDDEDGEGEDDEEEDEDESSDREDGEGNGDDEDAPHRANQRSKDPNAVRGRLDARRMLTDSDFSLLEKLRAAQAARSLDPRHRSKKSAQIIDSSAALKRKRDADEENDQDAVLVDYAVEPGSLAPSSRGEKASKIDRIMHMLDGRKEKRFEHEGHKGGLTDKEKLRLKNFVMVRKGKRSVSGKIRKSNSQTRHDKRESVSFDSCLYLFSILILTHVFSFSSSF